MTLGQELLRRTAVAAVALPLVAVLLWCGGLWSAALLSTVGAIAAHEYQRMTAVRDTGVYWVGTVALVALPVLPWAAGAHWPEAVLGMIAASSIAVWIWLLVRGPREDAPTRAGLIVGGIVLIGPGLVALAGLRVQPDGLSWVAMVLIAAWANDTGAFLGGKLVGRHRMIPAVSPGKTWEGSRVVRSPASRRVSQLARGSPG